MPTTNIITDITSATGFRTFTKELEQLLKEPLAQRGVHVKVGNGSISSDGSILTLKLETSLLNQDGTAVTKESSDFKLYCRHFGLVPEDLDRVVRYGGREIKIVGLMPKKRKFPILGLEVATGKRLCFPCEAIALLLGHQPAPTGDDPDFNRRMAAAERR